MRSNKKLVLPFGVYRSRGRIGRRIPMKPVTIRETHRFLALWLVLPFFFICFTGCLLQVKGFIPSLQPANLSSSNGSLDKILNPISLPLLLSAAKTVPEAKVSNWGDVDSVDVRPKLGVARLRTRNHYELQFDLANGSILSAGPRYTSLLIALHEGAYFGKMIHWALFIPVSVALLCLNFSGFCLLKKFYRKGKTA